ncbi:D-alanyl-D-alanine carboxypeptidase family protein [Kitasatospora sp. NPDC004240]
MQRSRFVSCWAAALGSALLSAGPVAGPATAQDAVSVIGGERLARSAVQVAPRAGAPTLPPKLTGRSWLVADAGTGEVLAAQNAHLPLPPASTLKMLFAETVLPKFERTAEHRVAPAELAGIGPGSSLVGIKENLTYRVEDLWRGVFLSSGNDAVHVLSHMNGGLARTVTEMQARADALQARDTHVISPDGYDQEGQVSSAYDLTLFARAGLRNADFRSYCGTRTARFPGAVDKVTGLRTTFDIANTDKLLGRYPGLIGVKNGYTTNAGATFTGAAERGGRTLLVTVMHPEAQVQVYDEAALLLDWGFAAAGRVDPVGRLVEDTTASSAPSPADGGLPRALEQADHALGPAGWTASALGAALILLAAGRSLKRRRRWSPAVPRPAAPELAVTEFSAPEFAVPEFSAPEFAVPEFSVPELIGAAPVTAGATALGTRAVGARAVGSTALGARRARGGTRRRLLRAFRARLHAPRTGRR